MIGLLETDRIIEINGYKLIVHDDCRLNRRNVVCHSDKLDLYIKLNNIPTDKVKFNNKITIGELINRSNPIHKDGYLFDDIKLIKVDGYY